MAEIDLVGDDLREGLASQGAVGNGGTLGPAAAAGRGGRGEVHEFPRLADERRRAAGQRSAEGFERSAAPDFFFVDRGELERVEGSRSHGVWMISGRGCERGV